MSTQAQQTFSFETSESYTLGNINGQNGWNSTVDGSGIYPSTQIISNDRASNGTYSLKLVKDPSYNTSPVAFMGAVFNFPTPVSTENMSFSADIYMTQKGGTAKSLLFGLVHFDNPNVPSYRTYFNYSYTGSSDVLVRGTTPGLLANINAGFSWQTNTWHTIKIVTNGSNVSFYADGTLLLSNQLITDGPVNQIRFAHDNYDGDIYIDNVKIESTLSTEDFNLSGITHFYDKNNDQLVLNSPDNAFSKIAVYNLLGQNVITESLNNAVETVDFSELANGVYLVEVAIGTTKKSFKILKS